MQWDMVLLVNLAAPFVAYYLLRDRIEKLMKRRAATRSQS